MRKYLVGGVFFFIGIYLFTSNNAFPKHEFSEDKIETIVSDSINPHEGNASGLPKKFSWAKGPRVNHIDDVNKFKAMTAWGLVYVDEKNKATNTRVQLRQLKAYILDEHNKWHLIQMTGVFEGAEFRGDFKNDINTPADIRKESKGSISVKVRKMHVFHFWPKGRVSIKPKTIKGFLVMVQARLIIDKRVKADDRDKAKYLVNAAADYWIDLKARWKSDWSSNSDIGIGRLKYVTRKWQSFYMTTLDKETLIKFSPPVL